MKVIKIKKEIFDRFVSNCPYHNYYQTSKYGQLMSKFGLKDTYYGFQQNNSLIGVTLILYKPVFMRFKHAYAPRGIIIDYTNPNIVIEAIKELKSTLFKDHFLMMKMDPYILCSYRDKKGNVISKNTLVPNIIKTLKQTGFNHCGFNVYFESVKPRWEAELNINKNPQELFKNLSKQTRNKLRKATKYGLTVYKDNKYDFEKIFPFIKTKEKFSLKYYQEMYKQFGNDLEVFYSKLDTRIYVENSKKFYERELEVNDYLTNIIQSNGYKGKDMSGILNKKMESDKLLSTYKKYLVIATELLKNHPEGIITGATITLKYLDRILLIAEGYDPKYKNLCSNYLIKWKIIEKYANSSIKIFNLNGISGNFDKDNKFKGLNEMKLSYNSYPIEYIGEFNLIINNPMYSLYKNIGSKK